MAEVRSITDLVRSLYPALAAGDRTALGGLLAPDFEGTLPGGLPLGLGGTRRGPEAMIEEVWWAIGRAFALRAEPAEWIDCAGGRLLVLGRYVGRCRATGAALDAPFAHLWSGRDGRLCGLWHLTDTALWRAAVEGGPDQKP